MPNRPLSDPPEEEKTIRYLWLEIILTGHLSSIDQGCGQVDQAGYDSPCGVECQTIQDNTVCNTPPEEREATWKTLGIISNIFSHEEHDKDVGDGNKEENDTGKDQKVSGFVGPEK